MLAAEPEEALVMGLAEVEPLPYAEPGVVAEGPHAASSGTSNPSPVTAHPRMRINVAPITLTVRPTQALHATGWARFIRLVTDP
jgi:hypothetical protein